MSAGEQSAESDDTLRRVLHDVWLAIHVRRFDADSPHDGRQQEVIDTFYRGITVAEQMVSRIARQNGIERVYDAIPGHQTDRRLIDGTPEQSTTPGTTS